MSYPLVRDLAPISDRELQDAYLTNALIDAHGDDPEFGYRLWADERERRWTICPPTRVRPVGCASCTSSGACQPAVCASRIAGITMLTTLRRRGPRG